MDGGAASALQCIGDEANVAVHLQLPLGSEPVRYIGVDEVVDLSEEVDVATPEHRIERTGGGWLPGAEMLELEDLQEVLVDVVRAGRLVISKRSEEDMLAECDPLHVNRLDGENRCDAVPGLDESLSPS